MPSSIPRKRYSSVRPAPNRQIPIESPAPTARRIPPAISSPEACPTTLNNTDIEGAPSEAEVLVARAKPTWREIVLETGSRNTHATGINVKKLLKGMRPGPVLVVTSPPHCLRAAAVFQNMEIAVRAVPILDTPWIQQRRSYMELKDLLPSLKGLIHANQALTELAAILWYLANGRFTPDDLFSSL